MYRVFEALDELVTIVEEARGVPMTASCVVPRGDVLELLDDVRDALPGEVDDAQDVLDHRDQMIDEANATAAKTVGDAQAEAHRLVSTAQAGAGTTVSGARAEADRLVMQASAHADSLVAKAQDEAARILDSAHADSDRMRQECDSYVDSTLASIEETLTTTLRTVGRGRTALRTGGVADFRD